jgi:O-antigen/teichoic acid export membrane protein
VHLFRVLRNILSTWVGYATTLVVGFLLAPFVVHHLGNTGYGAWTLVTALTGYFGMLDLGLRQSVGRFVARSMALNDHTNVNRTISNALAMLGTAGLLTLLATAVASFAFSAFHLEQHTRNDARLALLITGASICLALPMSVFNAVLFSLERFDIVTGITLMGSLLRSSLVVLVLSRGHGLVALALVTLIASATEYLVAAVCAKLLFRPLRPGLRHISLAGCRELFTFGIFRFIWIVANQLIFYSDSIVIGVFLNAAAITYFAIAGSLINYGRNIVSLAADTFCPAATQLDAQKNEAGLQNLLIFGTRVSLSVGLPLCLGFLFLGKQFIVLWMGPAYAISATYLAILTIPQFSSMAQYISAVVLVGMARHKVLAFVAIAEGVANLLLSILLVRQIGLVGVAWGTAIPHAFVTLVVIPGYVLRTLNMGWRAYVVRAVLPATAGAIPAGLVCWAFSNLITEASWFAFGMEALSVATVAGLMGYFTCLSPVQRSKVLQKLRRNRFTEQATEVGQG